MDSPVIGCTRTDFGRGLDLDREFPGFPFDEEGFGRRSDIRTHLDDLASRHPEFADHLLGPPWGDVPFNGGSLRNRRRGSGSNNSSFNHNHPDEDARSQSSSGSAASGASGVSSHGDPTERLTENQNNQENLKNHIPHYGLRNTVDIGQHQHTMDKMADLGKNESRNQRSMSAPPENRQQQNESPQKYVSRVDITPQKQQKQSNSDQSNQQQQREKSPGIQQKQSNVRHIPIFVEGRDEPVIPRETDETDFTSRQSPPPPPQFQRPSQFQQHYKPHHTQWDPFHRNPFPDPFFEESARPSSRWDRHHDSPFGTRHTTQQQQHTPDSKTRAQPQQHKVPRPQPQQVVEENQQQHQQEEPERPQKPVVPKDPLEKVAAVQKEVDSLMEQVKQYTGNSRQDKQYMYLDEMLTRELIKLDDIDTEGKENVRQSRKTAIKSIQECIALLESKAMPTGQQQNKENQEPQALPETNKTDESKRQIKVEVEPDSLVASNQNNDETQKAIPLPPCPSMIVNEENEKDKENQQQNIDEQLSQPNNDNANEAVDINRHSPVKDTCKVLEQKTNNELERIEVTSKKELPESENLKFDTEDKAAKSPKKAKKTRQPTKIAPVSETAIPLPAPDGVI